MARQDSLYEIQQKITMSQKIVKKDKEYGEYAGGSLIINNRLAKILTLKKAELIPESLKPLIDFYLIYLDQQRKAFVGSVSTELTKLGFILGDERTYISASKPK